MPGNKGGTGRPPKVYKEFIAEELTAPEHQGQVRAILRNGNHPAFAAVYGKVLIHHLGVPKPQEGGDGQSPGLLLDV